MISLQIYKVPLLMSFGASKNTIGFASDYLQVYIYGTIFVQVSIGLNMFISSQGEAKTAMFSVIIGTVCNIILDPIFIFVFNMGVQGAALATVISQGISNIWILKFLLGPKTSIKIRRENLHLDSAIIGPVLALGIAPFIMQSTESLVNIVYNTQLHTLGGDNFVGAMTILTSIRMFLKAPIGGFANGVQPIISYNYGAGNNARVRDCYKKLLLTSVLFTTVVNILLYFFPGFFIGLFTNSPDLISISRHYLPIFTATFWIFGIQMASQNTFLGLNCPKQSLFIALLRKVICIIPLTFILPHFLGIAGVFWAEPISDTISATTSLILCILLLKNSVKVDTAKSRQ